MAAQITPLPTPPTPADTPADFNTKAFALLGGMPGFVAQANALSTEVNLRADGAAGSASTATTKAAAAAASEAAALASKNAAATSAGNSGSSATAASGSAAVAAASELSAVAAANTAVGIAASMGAGIGLAVRPTLLLDFANGMRADPRITYAREGVATRINARGQVEIVPANVPRIEYDPVTGACLGLLIEGSGTNLLTQSEFATGLSGSTSGGAVSATSFQGFLAGISVQRSAGASYVYKSASLSVGGTYTFSVFLRMDDGGAPVVSATASGDLTIVKEGYVSVVSVQPVHLGGGLYRVSLTHVITGAGANWGVAKYPTDTARGFRVTGFQLESGASTTSYIPTTTGAATRSFELAQMLGSNFTDWYRPEGGTFVVQSSRRSAAGTAIALGSADTATRMGIYGDQPNLQVVVDGVTQVQAQCYGGATTPGVTDTVAFAMEANDFAFVKNGGPVGVDTNGLIQSLTKPFNRLHMGSATFAVPGADFLFGHIRRIAYYPVRLPNEQLQALTAP